QKSRTRAKAPNTAYSRRHKVSLQGLQHGDSCWAIIEKVQHPLRRFKFWNVVALARKRQDLPKVSDGQRVVQGYLCITNQNIENKHDERLFFRAPDNTSVSQPLELSGTVRQHYEELIADYQERHRDAVQKRRKKGSPDEPLGREPAFSRFITQRTKKDEPKLKDGDLVYATLKRKGMGVEVDFIVPVSVPRVGYRRTIGELLHPDDLSACQDIEHLCPACRTFGWVHPSGKDDSQAAVAYAGRVRFTHACRRPGNGDSGSFSATLSILSTPKPTTTRFYLRPKQGKPRDGLPDSQVNYDADSQILRGRKFYRHHGDQLSEQEYKSPDGRKSDQNRTVHDVQPSGTEFEFTVDFENLAPIELGALLWSLEMEGWHHRIGYAKPLGFGSVIIQVTELEIMNPNSRYQSLVTDGWENVLSSKERWIDEFKTAMAGRYGTEFYKLPNVRDLQALLSDTPPLPVHYPRSTKEPQPEGRNYEWFVGNKRSGRNSGPR
ncbi:TIGR03986 family CRISPR-associated RAMP protein, partial [Candidatus Parcubacteria bacterium]